MTNHQEEALYELLAESDITKHASEETMRLLRQPYPLVPNTDKGFGIAADRFAELMDYELGTDEGDIVRRALEHKRWALQEHFHNLYNWDII
jgi:hypothetical protein